MDKFEFRDPMKSPDFLLWQVHSLWQRGKNKLIAPYGITSSQLTILGAIYWMQTQDLEVTQVALAENANMDPMTTSSVLRNLQKEKTGNQRRAWFRYKGEGSQFDQRGAGVDDGNL